MTGANGIEGRPAGSADGDVENLLHQRISGLESLGNLPFANLAGYKSCFHFWFFLVRDRIAVGWK